MAVTQLSDMIIPEVFGNYVVNQIQKTNRFVQSGILQPDPDMSGRLTQPGWGITVPFINDLSGDANVWTDTADITPDKLTSGKQQGQKMYQSKAFADTDLSGLVSGAPVENVIGDRFAQFWVRQDAKLLMAVLDGVFGVTKVKNSKLFDATAVSPSNADFSARGFIAAQGLMGDIADQALTGIAVNSATYAQMKANGLLDKNIQEQNAATPFGTYNGLTIFVDDDIPVDLTNKSHPVTTSYIFGRGAIAYSQNIWRTATERKELTNGGEDIVIQKRICAIHVIGTSVKAPVPNAGLSDVSASKNWEVVDGIDTKTIRVVAYKSTLDPMFVPGADQSASPTPAGGNSNTKSN